MTRKHIIGIVLPLFLLFAAAAAGAAEVVAVRPDTVAPGDRVAIDLEGDAAPVFLVLGDQVLAAEATGPGFAAFRIPYMPAGTYAVQILSEDEISTTPFQLNVLEPAPYITELSPANIPECAEAREKRVDVYGSNFFEGSRLLVDGSVVGSEIVDPQQMSFDASPLRAGVYGVQVVNSSGVRSVPFSLYVNNVPQIDSVTEGDSFTNHYELVIRGENFFQQSTLLVTEEPPGMTGQRPRQKTVWGKGRRTTEFDVLDRETEDFLFYRDCNTLVYYRFPLSGQEKELTIKVINPDGKASGSYQMFAN